MRHDRVARRSTPPGWPCSQAAPAELLPGTRVGDGRFEVGALLGRGGMASVYRGRDRRLRCDVALKVMLGSPGFGSSRAARFVHEAGLLARLPAHPGLLRLVHAGRLPELVGRPFLATTLVDGPTLAFRLAADLRMPARRSVALALGLSRALVVVHAAGLVHRDLTARNVMLAHAGGDAGPVVVDFGMAAVLERVPGTSRLTRPDQRPGTVTAMAPEQYLGAPPHPAMDVYALGRLLYEMLTAEDPHATVSHTRLLERHREGARVAPRLASRGDAGPPALRALVDACLDPHPTRRPASEDVVATLVAIERALERGGAVLSLAGRAGARELPGEPAPVMEPRSAVAGATVGRERWWWALYLAMTLVGVALGMGVARPIGRSVETPRGLLVELREPASVAWPSWVVPLATASERPPIATEPAIEPASAASPASRPRATAAQAPARALPSPVGACEAARERATAAARRWDWPAVLAATDDRTCWSDADERAQLRLTAWIEQRRFDACVEDGAEVRALTLVRLVERCRQRLAASEAHARDRGEDPS